MRTNLATDSNLKLLRGLSIPKGTLLGIRIGKDIFILSERYVKKRKEKEKGGTEHPEGERYIYIPEGEISGINPHRTNRHFA